MDANISPDALPPLRASLTKFRARVPEILDAMEREIARANRALGEHHEELERSARHWRSVAEMAEDEGEQAHAEQKLEEVEDRLRRLKRRIQEIRELLARYRADARNAREHCDAKTLAACHFVDKSHAAALAALAILAPGGGGTVAFSFTGAPGAAGPPALAANEVAKEELSLAQVAEELPVLPEGYDWIPVALAHPEVGRWPEHEEFIKVSYDAMRAGTKLLHAEMVPLFQRHPGAGRDVFEAYDLAHGRTSTGLVHPQSLAHLYDQFFHPHNMMRCRMRESDGLYEFENGRHRVRVAKDLGLRFVPAKIVGRRPA